MSIVDPVQPLLPRFQAVLDDFIGEQRALLREIGPELEPLADAAADLLSGGKRLRPAFCYWGWRGAGRPDDEAIIAAAAALELFQAAALAHDDLIDASDTRRGMPSVHRRFAAAHESNRWHGDPARFGAAASILLGDLLLSWSDELFTRSGLDHAALSRARPVFDRMRTEVGAGQFLDVLAQTIPADPAELADRARRIVRFKAAHYSVQRPLLLGGTAAGTDSSLLDAYADFGLKLGEAFQLRDDVLGVFGDPSETGKPAGDDLREGKRTLLIAYTLEQGEAVDDLTHLLGDPGLDESGVRSLQQVIVESGALARVENLIDELVDSARASLHDAPLAPDALEPLDVLTTAATARTR